MGPQEIEGDFTKNVYSSRDIRLAHPGWLEIWPKIKGEFGMDTGYCLEISCTYRSPTAQNELFQIGRVKQGKVVTYFDGIEKLSVHNIFPSRAIDVYIHKGGKVIWDPEIFDLLEPLAEKWKLIWGGSWKSLRDRPHLEIPQGNDLIAQI